MATGLRALFSVPNMEDAEGRFKCVACEKTFANSYWKTTSKLREHVARCEAIPPDVREMHGPDAVTPKKKRAKIIMEDGEEVEGALGFTLAPSKSRYRTRVSVSLTSLALLTNSPSAFLGNEQLGRLLAEMRRGLDLPVTKRGSLVPLVAGAAAVPLLLPTPA